MKNCRNYVYLILLLIIGVSLFEHNNRIITNSNNKDTSENNFINSLTLQQAIHYEWNTTIIKSGDDAGNDIIIDQNGDLFVAGKIYNESEGIFDVFFAKYNILGVQEWNKTWQADSDSVAYGIDIDPSNQYLYLTGYTINASTNVNIFLLKYDINGVFQWNRTWEGHEFECGYAVKVNQSNANEIYIAGYTESLGQLGDVILLKYNSTGDLQWEKNWDNADTDNANDLVIAQNGDIYITGLTNTAQAQAQLLLLKYNSSLNNFEWNATWGGGYNEEGEAIQIDSNNNIYISGYSSSYSQGATDMAILKFYQNGTLMWNKTWGGSDPDAAYGIAIDSNNNYYIVGYTESYGGADRTACIVKYNSTGIFQWYKLWDNELEDLFYSICINSSNYLFIIGITERTITDINIVITHYSPRPDNFQLISNARNLDPEGNFTLSWSESLDAENYTVYHDDVYISALDGSQDVIINGNTNRSIEIKKLAQGIHYYIVEAVNSYGNTTSNCIKIEILYPPGTFILDENDETPDLDGKLNLTWSSAARADNYSVYVHSSYIVKIENNGTLVKSGITCNNWTIEDLPNVDYFYIIIAYNRAGQNQSNCIEVSVRRKPDVFLLSHNGGKPDTDGSFELIWTFSKFSANYTIYISTNFITDISAAQEVYVFIPAFELPSYTYSQKRNTGTYYYVIVAKNVYGNYTTKCVNITVKIPLAISASDDDDDNDEDGAPIDWDLIISIVSALSLGGLLATSYILWKKKKGYPKKRKYSQKNFNFFSIKFFSFIYNHY